MKQNRLFYVIGTMVIMMTMMFGCQKASANNNQYFLVSEQFVSGYGLKGLAFVKDDENYYAVGDAAEASVHEKYGIGYDYTEKYNATGMYTPINWSQEYSQSNLPGTLVLSYGDFDPVVFKKSENQLFTKKDLSSLDLYSVEFVGYTIPVSTTNKWIDLSWDNGGETKRFSEIVVTDGSGNVVEDYNHLKANKEYDVTIDGSESFTMKASCKVYRVLDNKYTVYASTKSSDGVIYDTANLNAGLYFVDGAFGLVEVK